MSYPYGQPPHQPGYPAPGPGYPAPAYAAAPAPYGYPQPIGYPQARPSGGTGITAGILALLGAVSCTLTGIAMFVRAFAISENGAVPAAGARRRGSTSGSSSSGTDIDIDFEGVSVVFGIAYILLALMLLIGGILLLCRKSTGRVMVITGCGVCIATALIVSFSMPNAQTSVLGGFVFAILTLVLAAVGSTKRWIDAGRMPAPTGGYGPAPYGGY